MEVEPKFNKIKKINKVWKAVENYKANIIQRKYFFPTKKTPLNVGKILQTDKQSIWGGGERNAKNHKDLKLKWFSLIHSIEGKWGLWQKKKKQLKGFSAGSGETREKYLKKKLRLLQVLELFSDFPGAAFNWRRLTRRIMH